jgi:hypothetical protein
MNLLGSYCLECSRPVVRLLISLSAECFGVLLVRRSRGIHLQKRVRFLLIALGALFIVGGLLVGFHGSL